MDDKVVGINNGELVIRVVTCMTMIHSYVPECLGGSYSFFAEFQIFCSIFTLSSKFSLIFKWPKSEETSIGDFFLS